MTKIQPQKQQPRMMKASRIANQLGRLSLLSVLLVGQSYGFVNNGKLVDESQFPSVHQIVIKKNNTPSGTCTGVAIDHNVILTAAHCALGDDGLRNSLEVYGIKSKRIEVKVHPLYSQAIKSINDLKSKFNKAVSSIPGMKEVEYSRQGQPLLTDAQKAEIKALTEQMTIEETVQKSSEDMNKHDLAMMILDESLQLKVSELYLKELGFLDSVEVVGYGSNTFEVGFRVGQTDYFSTMSSASKEDDGQAGRLRTGSSKVYSTSNDIIEIAGNISNVTQDNVMSPVGTGVDVTANHGDSGGPLLFEGQVVGIAHAIRPDMLKSGKVILKTTYVKVALPQNLEFIQTVLK